MTRLIRLNKPFGVLSQFTARGTEGSPRATLADYVQVSGVYPAGRLDRDSEGLLLLTDNGRLQARIAQPGRKMPKTYLAQVEGAPTPETVARLSEGVTLKDGPARATFARIVPEPDWLWPRDPPIRVRKSIPDSWIELTLTEGRNRQVRRMTAAIGHPTLRLIRTQIGPWTLEGLAPGRWDDLDPRA